MKTINDKALLLKLRNPNRVLTTIPKSKATGDNEVAVHWGVDEVHTLGHRRSAHPAEHGTQCTIPHRETIRLAGALQAHGSPANHSVIPHTEPQSVLLQRARYRQDRVSYLGRGLLDAAR